MDDKTRIEILEDWLDNPDHMGKIPKRLEGKISKEDIRRLILEIGKYGHKEVILQDIARYLDELKDRSFKGETLKIQKDVKTTQWGIAIAMALTFLTALGGSVITWMNYQTQLELNAPLFEVNLNCAPVSSDKREVSMLVKVTNHGKVGADVYGILSTKGDIEIRNPIVNGIPQDFTGEERGLSRRYVEGGATQEYLNYSMTTLNAKNDFEVIFTFHCVDINEKYHCQFVRTTVSCDYYSNGTHYLNRQQAMV